MAKWQPTMFLRLIETLDTSMATARIKTDAGTAYIKAIGNNQGPHQLACELVGTALARLIGLPTFDYAIIQIDADLDRLELARGVRALSGSAFVTRALPQVPWDGTERELKRLVNPEDIALLVAFDTWTRNCDRHPPDHAQRRPNLDNVFLEKLGSGKNRRVRLIAMDHSCCFTCNNELVARNLRKIEWIRDDRLYGLFPAFKSTVRQSHARRAAKRLAAIDAGAVRSVVATIPSDWEVTGDIREALASSLVQRAAYVANEFVAKLSKQCWPEQLFDVDDLPEDEI
jgi:hypothetical protein